MENRNKGKSLKNVFKDENNFQRDKAILFMKYHPKFIILNQKEEVHKALLLPSYR